MGKIIDSQNISEYKIEKFQFQSLNREKDSEYQDITSIFESSFKEDENKDLDESKPPENSDSRHEELLKKIDMLSSEVIALQMKLENSEKEHEIEIMNVKESSYQEGVKEAVNDSIGEVEELKIQYISTITKLQESGIEIESKLDKIEDELIGPSIAIAKKVIVKELEESSVGVAKAITRHLLNEIKDFTSVSLVVNPTDYEEILKSFEPNGLSITKDSSITKGGVMLYNENKNIDATVETRFKRALALIKES